MTSAPIEGRGCTIHQLFNGHRYQLDYYQREYTWESENVRRLVAGVCQSRCDGE